MKIGVQYTVLELWLSSSVLTNGQHVVTVIYQSRFGYQGVDYGEYQHTVINFDGISYGIRLQYHRQNALTSVCLCRWSICTLLSYPDLPDWICWIWGNLTRARPLSHHAHGKKQHLEKQQHCGGILRETNNCTGICVAREFLSSS